MCLLLFACQHCCDLVTRGSLWVYSYPKHKLTHTHTAGKECQITVVQCDQMHDASLCYSCTIIYGGECRVINAQNGEGGTKCMKDNKYTLLCINHSKSF